MINYTCDVCGAVLPEDYQRTRRGEIEKLCGVDDVCTACKERARLLDIPAMILDAWKKQPVELPKEENAEAAPAEPEILREKDAVVQMATARKKLRQDTARRLREFHQVNGLGSLERVAVKLKRAKITSMELRDAINGQAPDLTDDQWRKIAAALDKVEEEKRAE